jgi:hypothetical protein
MKTLLALAAILSAAALASVPAAAINDNRFGLYFDQAATIDEIDIAENSQQVLYLVLINPVSDFGSVQLVGGFECSIVPASGDFLLGVTFPLNAINLTGNVDDLIVGYAQGLAVDSGGGTTLATLSVLALGNNPEGYCLGPPSQSSHPNNMVYLDLGTFGDFTVEEDKTWGDVKSLYR